MRNFKKELLERMGDELSFIVVLSTVIFGGILIGAALIVDFVSYNTGILISGTGIMYIIGFIAFLLGAFLQ